MSKKKASLKRSPKNSSPQNTRALTNKEISARIIVTERIQELQRENEVIKQIVDDQIGTEIPKVFTSIDRNFVIDPSNVGTGILDRMIKTDDTVNSAVQFKIMMILSKLGEYSHKDDKITQFVQSYLENMRMPTWSSALESMLSFHGYKFSVSEIVFSLKDNLQKVPMRVATYHPSTIAFEVDKNGNVTEDGILQYTQQRAIQFSLNNRFQSITHGFKVNNPFSTPVDRLHPWRTPIFSQLGLVRIPRNKVIHLMGQEWHGFGNPYGNSGVRTAHLLWQLKVFILKQMGISSKRKGTPKIWGTAPKGAQQVEVTRGDGTKAQVTTQESLRLMLQDVQNFDSIVTGPQTDGWSVTTLDDTTDLSQFIDVINGLNTWIFRCFLLPSLILTDGQAGSRSLGDKHFQIVDRIAEQDADKFGEQLINQMIERTIIENFGDQDNYGQFLRRPQTIEEQQRLASMFGQLGNDGWMSPTLKEDMDFVRDSLRLTPLDDSFFKPFELDADADFKTDLPPGTKIPEGGEQPGIEVNPQKADIVLKVLDAISESKISTQAAEILLVESGIDPKRAKEILAGTPEPPPLPTVPEPTEPVKPGEPVAKSPAEQSENIDKEAKEKAPKVDDEEDEKLSRQFKSWFSHTFLGERKTDESKADCVARKIKVLIDEGKSQDEAVAIANSLCEE